jgi:hypothetical protein
VLQVSQYIVLVPFNKNYLLFDLLLGTFFLAKSMLFETEKINMKAEIMKIV